MLRSLYSGIAGLRAHQTMLDVTGNNIANVNTAGFKSSSVEFQDTLSQLVSGATGPGDEAGATNPSQVGLGVKVAGIATDFTEGSAQPTGRQTDLMINGDGFFQVSLGGQTFYTRDGSFHFDTSGRLTGSSGALVQGWVADADGTLDTTGATETVRLPQSSISSATATTQMRLAGNLPSDSEDGATIVRDAPVYDADGTRSTLSLTFTYDKANSAWNVSDGTDTGTLHFAGGTLTPASASTFTLGGYQVDLSGVTSYAEISSLAVESQDGKSAGTLQSYTIGADGTITGSYSNGDTAPIARIALANFPNPEGLQKAGGSTYIGTASSGVPTVTTPGTGGVGDFSVGYLEMSNVDLSEEFTNLIVAQRGFQANARIITTSDEVLQEIVRLKQ